MEAIYNKIFLKHKIATHPERPERLNYFDKKCKETKLENGEKFLKLIYKKHYIDYIKNYSNHELHFDSDTYTNSESFNVACFAVSAALKASKNQDFSLGRPPGHHASAEKPMGFCLFNNLAVAVQNLVNQGKKVFILDFDGHHGNGTQEIFYDTNQVLYLSTHQFPAFPNTGWIDDAGKGKGKGYTINIPMPIYAGDDMFLETMQDFLVTIQKKFNPDVVAVSAGFDAHIADPLLQLDLTNNSFFSLGKFLRKNFDNVFACLEGGYNVEFLHKNILDFINGINGKTQKFKEESTITPDVTAKEFKLRVRMAKERSIFF